MAGFDIPPLQLPQSLRPAVIDWSALNGIGDAIAAARRKQQIGEAVASGGGDPEKIATALGEIGATDEARHYAALAQHKAALAQSGAQHRESLDVQREHNRATESLARANLEGGKVPPGFSRTPEGALTAITGGPADPKYLESATEAKAKPRQFNVSDISKLSEEGGKFQSLSGFANTFEPRFAGYGSETIGNAATFAGRYVPALTTKNAADAAGWWQGYDRFKNITRNELFGAALTKNEQAAFEKADINPGMAPGLIAKNLARQQEVVQNGIKRRANALIQSGYDPAAIGSAYGIDLGQLGVTATKRGTTVPPPAPGSTEPIIPNAVKTQSIPQPPPGFQIVQ